MHRKRLIFFFSGIILFCFLLITNPFGLYFLCDDFVHVPEAAQGNFFHDHLLRPVLYISLFLDFKLCGMNPAGFHVTNLLIHLANSVLVFILAKQFMRLGRFAFDNINLTAWFCSILFLSYAFHSEPIFWIVARDSTIATFFVLLSLVFFFTGGRAGYIASLLSFTVALFTYELSWVLPIMLFNVFLYKRFVSHKWQGIARILGYWLLFVGYIFLRFYFLKSGLGYGTGNIIQGNYFRILRNFAALFARLFIPPTQQSILFIFLFLMVLVAVALLLYRIWKKTRHHYYGLLLLLFLLLISLIPVLSLGIDTHDSESERFIYLGSVFLCIFCVFLLSSLHWNKNVLLGSMALLIAINLFGLFLSAQSYKYASYVARSTIASLNKIPDAKKITFINLPSQYKGALLFRVGFPKSASLILQAKYDSVTILSYKELYAPEMFETTNKYLKDSNKGLIVEFTYKEIILR